MAYYISRIITMPHEPKACGECGKENYLVKNVVHDTIGKGNTFLCTQCETINIVSKNSPDKIALVSAKGEQVTVRSNIKYGKS